jgi:hypothetical protein
MGSFFAKKKGEGCRLWQDAYFYYSYSQWHYC